MPSESRNLPEQEHSIKARAHELYVGPSQLESASPVVRPFPEYLRETPAVPFSTFTNVMLWIGGIIVAILFVAAIWRAANGHGPRRHVRAVRPAARSALLHTPGNPPSHPARDVPDLRVSYAISETTLNDTSQGLNRR